MGIGIAFGAPIESGQTAYTATAQHVFSGLAQVAETVAQEKGLGLFHQSSQSEGRLYLKVCPPEEPVEFFVDGDHIVVWARTSSAGPGYHVFLIEFLGLVLDFS